MSGLGGLNKSPDGVVIGLIQLQASSVAALEDLKAQTQRICNMVANARQSRPAMDLVVFPEYSLSRTPDITCRMDGPEVEAFRTACRDNRIWGCFSLIEYNPEGNPYNTGIIIDDTGELKLYYRKLHPWVPNEPWEPGNLGIPVCEGPNGSTLALAICHDGMFPEFARECAYQGADIMIRTAGYGSAIRHSWRITNQANAFCNLMYTASVCTSGGLAGMGEGMIVNFDGVPLVMGSGRPDEMITGELRPKLVREARCLWGVENNIYQLGHRGYVAVKGGAADCPYTYMKDLMQGSYRLPWEDEVVHKDGTSLGFPALVREYKKAAEA